MQWLTDIVFEMIAATMKGIIVAWFGPIAAIPDGWALCDGTRGTPDLRDKEIVGVGLAYSPDDEGGAAQHNHTFRGDGHDHTVPPVTSIQVGGGARIPTEFSDARGTTDNGNTLGPYNARAFIKRL